MKRIAISLLIAAGLMAGFLALANRPSNGPNIFSVMEMPFYMVGALFSSNAHAPSEIACYSSMFLFFFFISFRAYVAWSNWRRGKSENPPEDDLT